MEAPPEMVTLWGLRYFLGIYTWIMMIIMFNNLDIVMKEQQKQSLSDILLHLFINNSSDGSGKAHTHNIAFKSRVMCGGGKHACHSNEQAAAVY